MSVLKQYKQTRLWATGFFPENRKLTFNKSALNGELWKSNFEYQVAISRLFQGICFTKRSLTIPELKRISGFWEKKYHFIKVLSSSTRLQNGLLNAVGLIRATKKYKYK